jgi:hypothetical protein
MPRCASHQDIVRISLAIEIASAENSGGVGTALDRFMVGSMSMRQ